jgi:hypothetical protein
MQDSQFRARSFPVYSLICWASDGTEFAASLCQVQICGKPSPPRKFGSSLIFSLLAAEKGSLVTSPTAKMRTIKITRAA